MGNFYTNITLQGPSQAEVIETVRRLGRTAYVSPTINDYTVVYDRETEDQDVAVLEDLAALLSDRLKCVALAVLNHDDDVLLYRLYDSGDLLDAYDPSPGGFYDEDDDDFDDDDDDDLFDEEPPMPGDADALCAAVGMPEMAPRVDQILNEDEDYVFAIDRHDDLAQALHLPMHAVGVGYDYIEMDDVPEDVDISTFTLIEEL